MRRYEPDPPSRRDPRPDVAGYSRLMGADEEGMFERLKALRHELVDPKIAERHGGIVETTGGGGGRQRGRRFRITLASSMSALTGIMSSARSVLW